MANAARRTPQPVSEISLATNCGGSDGNSGHHRQPRARLGGGRAGALRRHRRARGDAGDLRRRAPADPPRRSARAWPRSSSTATSGGSGTAGASRRMDNNPAPGNKAGGITTVFEKSLGGVTKGGTTPHDGRVPVRRADHHARLRVHGHAGPRPGVDHGPRGGRLQRDLLHHRARLGLRLQAGAVHQARDQLASCTGTWRRTWTSTAA